MKKTGQDLTKTILLSLGAVATAGALTTVVACGVDNDNKADEQKSLTNSKNKKLKLKKIADAIQKFKNKLKGLDIKELEHQRNEIEEQIKILGDIKSEQEILSKLIIIEQKTIKNDEDIEKITQHINDENDKWMEQLVQKQAAFEKDLKKAENAKVKNPQEIHVIKTLLAEAKKNANEILLKGKKLQTKLIEKQKLANKGKASKNKQAIKDSRQKIENLINTLFPEYRPTIKGNLKQDSAQVQSQITKLQKTLTKVIANIQKIKEINTQIAIENNKMKEMQSETNMGKVSDSPALKGTTNPKLVYKKIK